jgi:hypothetical protein
MANPFYVEPASPFQGIMALTEGIGNRVEYERKKTEEAKKQEVRGKMRDAVKSGNIDALADLAVENPWITEELDKFYKFKNEATKANALETAKNILMGGSSPSQALIDRADMVLSEGGDPSHTIELAKKAQVDPKVAKKVAKGLLAFYDKPAYDAYKDMQKEDQPKTQIVDGQLVTITPEGEASASPIEGLQTKDKQPTSDFERWQKNPEEFAKFKEASKKQGEDLEIGYKTYLSANKLENSPKSYANYQRNQASQKKAMQKATVTRPYMAQLMADGYIPSTRVTGPMLDAYEAAAQKAAEQGHPLTVEDLRNMEFEAVKNRATGQAAGSRLVIARKQNIEAASGLLADLKETSKKLNYSPVKFVAQIDKWKKGQLNDPVLTEYMTQRADALFVLGNALKQNGLTDKSIEVEEEAYNPTLSPEAFNGWYNAQMRALNRAAQEINKDYKYGIPTPSTVPAGKGGAGPATDTMVSMSPTDKQALDWANSNPNDLRAAKIKAKLGAQ